MNACDNTSNNIYITGLQLEIGSTATDFEHRSFADELQKCLRYYEHSYPYGSYAGNTSHTGSYANAGSQVTSSNTTGRLDGATAVIWDFDNNSGKLFRHSYGSAGANDQSADPGNFSDTGFNMYSEGSHNATGWLAHWVADSEL